MDWAVRHLSVGLLALTTLGAAQGAAPGPGTPTTGEATFTILLHGVRLGTESVSMTRVSDGWQVVSTGHQNAPIDLQNARFDMTYADDWAPRHLTLDALLHGQPIRLTSTFSATSATNDVTSSAKTGTFTQAITPGTVVLPNSFYGAYEALAVRLSTMKVGDTIPLYVAPDGEVTAQVRTITPRRIATPGARLDFREFELSVATSVSQPIQIWIDDHSRLARVILPAAAITVARSDLATVMAREELVTNSGDAATFIPILGFTAGATVTTPTGPAGRRPAVVLVPGFGPQDRDESVGGVPVFGLLAGAIADAGYLVVRYDRRGVGQSGGRPENATLEDYRDDLLEVIKWVRQRKDVDPDRVAVVGYADGGAIAMLAAQKEDAIRGLGLLAVPGSPGRDYVLEQQTLALAGMQLSEADRAAKIDLEHRLIESALTGKGWETLPPDLSHGADQPIFKSWLLFNPTVALKKVNQPVLILQGLADAELPRAHADRLAGAAQARKRPLQATTVVLVPGVSHALTRAVGTTVGPAGLSTDVDTAVTGWLHDLFTRPK
jgi:pimeloyl-ACP methyl ester carboxylesterase